MDDDTLALALLTLLDTLSTFTAALLAASGSGVFEFDYFAVVNIFKCDWECLFGWFDFWHLFGSGGCASSTSSSTEEHVEDVVTLSSLGSVNTVLVVHSPLFRVAEGLVCLVKLLELLDVSGLLIWVKLSGKLFKFVLDFLLAGIFLKPHEVVVLLVVDLLLLLIVL